MAPPGKNAARVADQGKFEPRIRDQGGAITPNISWCLYAEYPVDPLRRIFTGSITPNMKWLHIGEHSHAGRLPGSIGNMFKPSLIKLVTQ
jgi:hypothetical protein